MKTIRLFLLSTAACILAVPLAFPEASGQSRAITQTMGELAPTVTTNAASGITTDGATLNATVNPGGLATDVHFYEGFKLLAGPVNVPAGSSDVPVNVPVSNFVPGSVHTVRATATNAQGTTLGNEVKFTLAGPGAHILQTIYRWQASGRQTEAPVVKAGDGNLYGVTTAGGAVDQGTIYRVTPAGDYSVIYNFDSNAPTPAQRPGVQPVGGLVVGNDGALYGTASGGGQFFSGTIFRITTDGVFSVVHAFAAGEGTQPFGTLIKDAAGNLYGTTRFGGAASQGTIFKCTPAGVLTTLHSFTGSAGGAQPRAGVIFGSDGHLYGTTRQGGAGGNFGTVYQLTQPGNVFTVLHSFGGTTQGSDPWTGLVERSGILYGATSAGGTSSAGTLFSITPGGVFAIVHHFNGGSGASSTGGTPYGGLTLGSDNELYGTAYSGGLSGLGALYRFVPGSGVFVLKSFTGTDGMNPSTPMTDGGDGFLYGTTFQNSGSGSRGVIFQLAIPAGGYTLLSAQPDRGRVASAAVPTAGLIKGADGNFYGVTDVGGTSDRGTIFKLSRSGAHSLLHSFNFTDGTRPQGELIEVTPGEFYSTTFQGGTAGGHGTIFKITSAGTHTVEHNFSAGASGGTPISRLIDGGDGALYGVASSGGSGGTGVFFKHTPGGVTTAVASFVFANGNQPVSVIKGSDGNFYGTTKFGGANSSGVIFKIAVSGGAGTITALHNFTGGAGGTQPLAGVVEGPDGFLYGTVSNGGGGGGAAYKIDPNTPGSFTIIHPFAFSTEGNNPQGELVLANGAFYGTLREGGTNNNGSVFKMTPAGTVTVLHAFNNTTGRNPSGPLYYDATSGSLWGLTEGDNVAGGGTVFQIGGIDFAPPSVATMPVTDITPTGATLKATVHPGALETTVYFYEGAGLLAGPVIVPAGTANVLVTAPVSGLTPGSMHTVYAYASNSQGATSGNEVNFIALGGAPTIATNPATDLTTTTATLHATVNPNGVASQVYFYEGFTLLAGPFDVAAGYGNVTVDALVAGFTPGSAHTVYAFVTNTYFSANGNDASFTLLGGAPIVSTGAASVVTTTTATLHATVNSNGVDSTLYFYEGFTLVAGPINVPASFSPATFDAPISGGTPGSMHTVYAYVTNAYFSVNGNDSTFTYLGGPPTVSTGDVTDNNTTTATLHATVNSNGVDSTLYFYEGSTLVAGPIAVPASFEPATFDAPITGGVPGSAHTIYAYVTNAYFAVDGNEKGYTHLGGAPIVTTNAPTDIKNTTATLHATVNPNGVASIVYFYEGVTNYGGVNVPAGFAPVQVELPVSGFTPGSTHTFYAYVTNSYFTATGNDVTVTFLEPGAPDALDAGIIGNYVTAIAVQPDEKVILGGEFTSVQGVGRTNLARLNADGSLDTSFVPAVPDGAIFAIALQYDGKVLVGGVFNNFNGSPRVGLARLHANGSLDTGFTLRANNVVRALAVQPDGKVIIAGLFSGLQQTESGPLVLRDRIARIEPDGTLDEGFNPSANNNVLSVAVQPDGKVLLGGAFTTLQPNGAPSPITRNYIARVNEDGSLDPDFDPNVNPGGPGAQVVSLAVQPDGKILLGGDFIALQPNGAASPTTRNRIARLHDDGTLDATFDPNANHTVLTLALQGDGKILVGGHFSNFQPAGEPAPVSRNRIARLNSDGSVDAFNPNPDGDSTLSLALQADGRVLAGGQFVNFYLNGSPTPTPRNRFARLSNDETASQTFYAPDLTQLYWLRSGSTAELAHVAFELSTNGGTSWTPLGDGVRVGTSAQWHLTGLSLPGDCLVRARGRTAGAYYTGSGGLIEEVLAIAEPAPTRQWTQHAHGINDRGTSVRVDGAGNVFVAGIISPVGFPFTLGAFYLAKYSPAGALLWDVSVPGMNGNYPVKLGLDGDGNAFVGATTYLNEDDFYVAKYDGATGTLLWERTYGGTVTNGTGSYDVLRGLAVDATGHVVVTGVTNTNYNDGIGNNATDYYTARYAPDGTPVWGVAFDGGSNQFDAPIDVAVDSGGNAVVVGSSTGPTGFADFHTVKFAASNGSVLWQRYEHNNTIGGAAAVAVDGGDNVAVSGTLAGIMHAVVKYSAAGATLWGPIEFITGGEARDVAVDSAGNVIVANWTYADARILKLAAANGALQWAATFSDSVPTSLAVNAAGDVYVAGDHTRASIDYYLAKYAAADGATRWVQYYDGPYHSIDSTGNSFDHVLALTPDGGAVVTGGTRNGVFIGSSTDITTVKFGAIADSTLPPTLNTPASSSATNSNNIAVSYHLPESAAPGSVVLTFHNTTTASVTTVTVDTLGEKAGTHTRTVDVTNPGFGFAGVTGGPLDEGVYHVAVSYQDAEGSAAAFDVHTGVTLDFTAPELTVPANMLVQTTNLAGTVVSFTASATDNLDATVSVLANPPSGSIFSVGTTTVNVTATDDAGNQDAASFTVTVVFVEDFPSVDTSVALLRGDLAPNGPADAMFAVIAPPSLNASGHLAFRGSSFVTDDGTITTANDMMIWADKGATALALVAREGSAAPGGGQFKTLFHPIQSANDAVTFKAQLATGSGVTTLNDEAIYTDLGGALARVIREGDESSGSGSAVYKTLTSAAAVDDGIFGVATLKSGTSQIVTGANDIVFWAWAPGFSEPAIRLREGQTIALSTTPLVTRMVKSFEVLKEKAGVVGQGRSFNNAPEVLIRVVCTDNSVAFARLSNDSGFLDKTEVVTAVIKGVSPVPSSGPSEPAGARFATIDAPAVNALGHRAFKGTAVPGASPLVAAANDSMIWADNDSTALALVAREGAAAPGTTGIFSSFMDPIISDDDSVAFLATLKTAPGITSANNQGLWAQTAEGLKLIARKGFTIKGVPAAADIKSFTSVVVHDEGGAISGKLRTGVGRVTANNDAFLAVWRDSDGAASVVLREGMWLEVSPGHPRAIKSFDVFTPQAPFKGVGRSHNAPGQIAVYCVFVDGTTGIFILEPNGVIGF